MNHQHWLSGLKMCCEFGPYETMIIHPSHISNSAKIVKDWTIDNLQISSDFCHFYRRIWKHILQSLIDVRRQIFMKKFSLVTKLPSTIDELVQHLKRTDHRAATYQHMLQANADILYGRLGRLRID